MRLITTGSLLIRIVLVGFFVMVATACFALVTKREFETAAKLGWIAALLLLFAAEPTRLLPWRAGASALSFYRVAFAALAVFFAVVTTFLVLFVQLPHERHPHFRGTIVRVESTPSVTKALLVKYRGEGGQIRTYLDTTAPVMYPKRAFHASQEVSVIETSREHPRLDEPLLVRWSTILLIGVATVLSASVAIACHLKYISR